MSKRSRRTRDKWRDKQWVKIETPKSFDNAIVAQTPITDPKQSIGRVLETTLFDVMKQDPKQYVTKLRFKIIEIKDNTAKTVLQGQEYSREYLRSLISRGSSMINFIDDFTTNDGAIVRVYVVAFSQSRLNSSRKHGIRLKAREVLNEKTSSLTYEDFAHEAVLGNIASDIHNEAKKVSNLRHVGIKKTKLIKLPPVANKDDS